MHIHFHTTDSSLRSAVEDFVDEWNNIKTTIKVQSSGSTGAPKSIQLEKKFMEASARMTGTHLELNKGDSALLCMSPETIAGKMMIVRSIVLEMELHVANITSTPFTDIDITTSIDFVAMVPVQVEASILHTPDKFKRIKKLIIGGGSISTQLNEKIIESGINSWQTFGMTETISHIAMRKIEGNSTVYRALPLISLSTNKGSLVISAPQLGIKELKTNDAVNLISSTSFVWLGRLDFVINSGGIKIHPERIEQKIGRIIASPYFSAGIPDEHLGQKHILCIEGNKSSLVKSQFETLLDKYTVPKEIYYFQSFVYTKSGKINRLKTLKAIINAEKQVL